VDVVQDDIGGLPRAVYSCSLTQMVSSTI
jgi:hypothetical protein